jgi:hypothetical protein
MYNLDLSFIYESNDQGCKYTEDYAAFKKYMLSLSSLKNILAETAGKALRVWQFKRGRKI